jgi:hypothetical protein
LKQVIDEACKNVMSCQMVVTSTFRLAKRKKKVEQHERIHFKPYFCKIKMKDITRQPR